MKEKQPHRVLLITGMSGAGKSTVLKTLEDIGWETVDNLPLTLLERLLAMPLADGENAARPLAIGIDSRTRGFDATNIVERITGQRDRRDNAISTVFLDCSGSELERRYSETRRRHPLAQDRPAGDGIAREREMMAPLRRWADFVIDTTSSTTHDLKQDVRSRFGVEGVKETILSIMSFGYARGLPRNADLVFDMRFLQNPYWDENLRALSGLDEPVALHIRADPAYHEAMTKIEDLLLTLLPRYQAEGKAYVTVAFGCTGGQHRSVHVAGRVAERLENAGFSSAVSHRDMVAGTHDSVLDKDGP